MNEITMNGTAFQVIAATPAKEAGYTLVLLKQNNRFALGKKDQKGVVREMWLNFKTLPKALKAAIA